MNSSSIKTYYKDIDEWPNRWEIEKQDIECGKKIIDSVFIPFIEFIIKKGFAKKTVKKHIDNLWLLGGEIIESVNNDEDIRRLEPELLIHEFIDDQGGPYSSHINTESEMRSFDSTCKKLYKFLKSEN